jgi:hypothetical protein
MRNRRSVVIAIALTGAATLSMAQGRQGGAGRGRAPAARPDRIAGRPNLNGIWQAINTANWNLEGHSAAPTAFPQLGALFSIPAGLSVIVDNNGTIPYTPEGLKKRQENQAGWPKSDPEAKCYMAGLPRATYMPYPFQIVQGETDILFLYEYAGANRAVHMINHTESPIDSWMGWSNGRWDGDTLLIEVKGFTDASWFDRAGNHHSDALTVTERYTLGAGGNPSQLRGAHRGSEDVHPAVDDPHAALPPFGRERSAASVQLRRILGGAALRRRETKAVEVNASTLRDNRCE